MYYDLVFKYLYDLIQGHWRTKGGDSRPQPWLPGLPMDGGPAGSCHDREQRMINGILENNVRTTERVVSVLMEGLRARQPQFPPHPQHLLPKLHPATPHNPAPTTRRKKNTL